MNEIMNEKLQYDTPSAQIVIFPQQDILTNSDGFGPIILPDDEW